MSNTQNISGKSKVYMVWMDGQDEQFWNQYQTIEDAVSDHGDGCEVFVSEPRFLGRYKRQVSLMKIKRRKK